MAYNDIPSCSPFHFLTLRSTGLGRHGPLCPLFNGGIFKTGGFLKGGGAKGRSKATERGSDVGGGVPPSHDWDIFENSGDFQGWRGFGQNGLKMCVPPK